MGLQQTVTFALLLTNIGVAYDRKEDTDLALKAYREAQSIRDALKVQNTVDYGNLAFNMAVLLEKKGDREAADRYFRTAYDTYGRAGYSGPFKEKALKNAVRLGY